MDRVTLPIHESHIHGFNQPNAKAWSFNPWLVEFMGIKPVAAAAAKLLQSCPTLCDPIDGSPPGSLVPGILQARTLEWVAISVSNAWKWKVKVKWLSHVRLFATPWTQPTRLLCPWDFPGKSIGVGCHCLLLQTPQHVLKTETTNVSYSSLWIIFWSKRPPAASGIRGWTSLCTHPEVRTSVAEIVLVQGKHAWAHVQVFCFLTVFSQF